MKNRRDHADPYAETLVLPQHADTAQASNGDRDPLALYEQYARELTGEAVPAPRPQAQASRKR